MPFGLPVLWAVHIPEQVLTGPWLVGSFLFAGLLALRGAWRMHEDEIPQAALLTALFFVASSIHVRLGPSSVHLLLNGLVGAVLGWRAAIALPVGLFLQAALLGHGSYSTLGVNACVMVLPALFAGLLFGRLRGVAWSRRPGWRLCVVGLCAAVWLTCLVGSVSLLATRGAALFAETEAVPMNGVPMHPLTWAGILLASVALALAERKLQHPPEFALGLLLGVLTVLLTLLLNSLVLLWGGVADWESLVALVFVAHLPLVVIEGTVLGFVVSFLARVRPQVFGGNQLSPSGNTSSSGTSH